MWHPVAQGDDDAQVDKGPHGEDWHTAHHLHQWTEGDGADGVTHPVADHHVAHHVHAQSARYIRLQQQQKSLMISEAF